jgi:hypothetical protein
MVSQLEFRLWSNGLTCAIFGGARKGVSMQQDQLRPLRELREHLARAIDEYNRHIPHADGEWLADLNRHRTWNLSILAELARLTHA